MKLLFHFGTADMATSNWYIEGLVHAVMVGIRQYDDMPSSDYARGTVLTSQTCIRILWA